MAEAGAGRTDAEITSRANAWIFWDKVRFAGIIAAMVALMMAFKAD